MTIKGVPVYRLELPAEYGDSTKGGPTTLHVGIDMHKRFSKLAVLDDVRAGIDFLTETTAAATRRIRADPNENVRAGPVREYHPNLAGT